MTEAALMCADALGRYLVEKYDLCLTGRQREGIELLLEKDSEALRRALYRFENKVMKRRGSELRSDRDKHNIAFLTEVEEQARSIEMRAESNKDTADDSLELSDSSIDKAFLLYSTPTTSQVELATPSSTDSNARHSTSTNPTSGLSQPSSLKTGGYPSTGDHDIVEAPHTIEQALGLLPYGFQYLMAVLVARGQLSWSSLPSDCARLFATSSVKEAMQQCLRSFREQSPLIDRLITPSVLEALDDLEREEKMLQDGQTYLHNEKDGWIGGKISFAGVLSIDRGNHVHVRLQMLGKRTSCRFSRRFGSSRFLRLKLAKQYDAPKERRALEEFLTSEPVRLLNHVFRPFCVKDKVVHMFEVRDEIDSIWTLYQWHGPWQDNVDGKLVKYLQRMALGLSPSVPGPLIPVDKVRKMEDIGRPGAIMTDGAAPISRAAMIKVATILGLHDIPAAVQARYNGAKGVWYVSPERDDEMEGDLWIGVRPSQTKLQRTHTTDVCHQVLDVLRTSTATTPSHLSEQIISRLSHNGVPHETLVKMQEKHLTKVFTQVFGYEGEHMDKLELAKIVDQLGNVSAAKARRNVPHMATLQHRATLEESFEEEEEGEGGEVAESMSTTYRSAFERVYDMLLAGFQMNASETLTSTTLEAIKDVLKRKRKKFQIEVDRSAEMLVIPDPVGVLQEGEIQLRFGRNSPLDPDTMKSVLYVKGDVLVTRHPCLTPTDIRKVKATTYTELADYTDVVIFSTKGDRSLADLLSGGDYDGDTVRVFWEPSLVAPFTNAVVGDHETRLSLADVFNQDTEAVDSFLNEAKQGERGAWLCKKFVKPLGVKDCKGIYGKLHQTAAFMMGDASQEAIDMAFKFNNGMDGVKTGLTIKLEVLQADNRRFDRLLPDWGRKSDKKALRQTNEPLPAKRETSLPSSVFDVLWTKAGKLLDALQGNYERRCNQDFAMDRDLASPWEEAHVKDRITDLQKQVMRSHCKSILRMHSEALGKYAREKRLRESGSVSPQKRVESTEQPGSCTPSLPTFSKLPMQFGAWVTEPDLAFEIAGLAIPAKQCQLHDCIDGEEMQRLKNILASCLYFEACSLRGFKEKAALEIAWSELLSIKAAAVAKRESQPVTIIPTSTANALRIRKHVAARP